MKKIWVHIANLHFAQSQQNFLLMTKKWPVREEKLRGYPKFSKSSIYLRQISSAVGGSKWYFVNCVLCDKNNKNNILWCILYIWLSLSWILTGHEKLFETEKVLVRGYRDRKSWPLRFRDRGSPTEHRYFCKIWILAL